MALNACGWRAHYSILSAYIHDLRPDDGHSGQVWLEEADDFLYKILGGELPPGKLPGVVSEYGRRR